MFNKIRLFISSLLIIFYGAGCSDSSTSSNFESPFEIHFEKLTGKIAFKSSYDNITIIDAAAKDAKIIKTNKIIWGDASVSLSPDGEKIVYAALDVNISLLFRLYTIGSDGKNDKQLTTPSNFTYHISPVWSYTGDRIFYLNQYFGTPVYSILPDGTNNSLITNFSVNGKVSVSQDLKLIALSTGLYNNIYLYNTQNDSLTKLTSYESSFLTSYSPVFSPDEQKIVYINRHGPNETPNQTPPYFFKIMIVNVDGTEEMEVVELPFESYISDTYVTWSPNGDKLAFNYGYEINNQSEANIFIINPNGTEQTQITFSDDFIGAPSWIE